MRGTRRGPNSRSSRNRRDSSNRWRRGAFARLRVVARKRSVAGFALGCRKRRGEGNDGDFMCLAEFDAGSGLRCCERGQRGKKRRKSSCDDGLSSSSRPRSGQTLAFDCNVRSCCRHVRWRRLGRFVLGRPAGSRDAHGSRIKVALRRSGMPRIDSSGVNISFEEACREATKLEAYRQEF